MASTPRAEPRSNAVDADREWERTAIPLIMALVIGVLNQFWGIVMRMKGCWFWNIDKFKIASR